MEGVFLLLVFFFYMVIRLLFWLRPDERARDRKRLALPLDLISQRRFADALPPIEAHLKAHPRSLEGLLARARCHLELDEPLLALADCTKAVNDENHLPQAYLIKGKAFLAMDHLEEALLEFDKAVWYDRGNPEPVCWRGLVRRRMGSHHAAEADLMLAARMGDENATFYLRQLQGSGTWS